MSPPWWWDLFRAVAGFAQGAITAIWWLNYRDGKKSLLNKELLTKRR